MYMLTLITYLFLIIHISHLLCIHSLQYRVFMHHILTYITHTSSYTSSSIYIIYIYSFIFSSAIVM